MGVGTAPLVGGVTPAPNGSAAPEAPCVEVTVLGRITPVQARRPVQDADIKNAVGGVAVIADTGTSVTGPDRRRTATLVAPTAVAEAGGTVETKSIGAGAWPFGAVSGAEVRASVGGWLCRTARLVAWSYPHAWRIAIEVFGPSPGGQNLGEAILAEPGGADRVLYRDEQSDRLSRVASRVVRATGITRRLIRRRRPLRRMPSPIGNAWRSGRIAQVRVRDDETGSAIGTRNGTTTPVVSPCRPRAGWGRKDPRIAGPSSPCF